MHYSNKESFNMKRLTAPTRIVIVDDHPMMRDGLAMRISSQSDWEVCGEAATEDEAFELVKQNCPDVVIIDIALKSGNGIELVKRIKSHNPSAKMLVVSAFQESLYAERALRAGAHGYLNKQETNDKVIEALRVVIKGERYISDELTKRMVSQALGKRSDTHDPMELLTDRELEIFRLIGSGLTTGAIAEQLYLSTHTIDTHRENIKRKLGAKTGAELSRLAIQFMLESV
jgi:DNA-binding NarL/FixJ family response regulator